MPAAALLFCALALCPPPGSAARTGPEAADPYSSRAPVRAPYATPADPYGSAIDLDRLVARLKATPAIGFFTKLALRSDVLDLRRRIEHARAAGERGRIAHTLRREFDGLVLKILALLDEDPALARDIYRAREAIWHSLVADARPGG